MGNEFAASGGQPLSATAPAGKIRKNSMSMGRQEDRIQLREVQQLWAAPRLFAEFRGAHAHDLRVEMAERA
jgi:hypothetical protein